MCQLYACFPGSQRSWRLLRNRRIPKKNSPVLNRRVDSRELYEITLPFQQSRIDLIKKRLSSKIKLLDVGCASGAFLSAVNEPLDDKSMWGKYDLVTDFGNNEHPFNIVEAYRTMHRLTKPSGYMWIIQEVYGGNGFYNLDKPFFENLAAVNQYEIFNAAYRLDKAFNVQYDIPCDKDLLSLIDFGKVDKVGITYIFRRTNSKDFKLPYQGYGATVPGNSRDTYYQSNISVHDQSFLWRNFIPHSIDSLSGPLMLRILIQRFKKKLPLIGKFFK